MDEPNADPAEGPRDGPDAAGGVRPPLDAITGSPAGSIPELRSPTEEPWQVRQVGEVVQGLTSPAPAMRAARRQLAWFALASVAVVLAVAVVVALL